MGDSGSVRPVVRFFAVFTGLVVLVWIGFLTGWWQVMAPAPQTIDRTSRPTPVVTRTVSSAQSTRDGEESGPHMVSGSVQSGDGSLLPEVSILWSPTDDPAVTEVLGQTASDGQYSVEVPATGHLRAGIWSTPERVYISSDQTGVDFVGMNLCPIAVTVLRPDGSPVDGQIVRARVDVTGRDAQPFAEQPTDSAGTAHFETLPCGVASFWVRRAGHPQGRRDNVDTMVEQRLTIQLVDGIAVTGRVTRVDGEPIEDARVHSGNASDLTDSDGLYGLVVDPANLSRVDVSAEGFASTSERLRIAAADAKDTELVLDFVLEQSRDVYVYCAGLPGDSCASVVPVFCTLPYLPVGEVCLGDPVVCRCPDGRGAIRGGGMAVEVAPTDTEVWLDMSGRGGIRGTVLIGGAPVDPSTGQCRVLVTRMPTALEDVPGGLSAGAQASCLPAGSFEILGLKEGRYLVRVTTSGGETNPPMVEVDGQVVDMGTIDIGGGGRIEGVVLDGVTGEGAPGESVVAYQGSNDTLQGIGQAVSAVEGRFTISGLPDGAYTVILPSRPFTKVEVRVDDGESEPVELTTGEASLLSQNGFGLETDDAGQLVVAEVDPDGNAAASGLETGDTVLGVTIGGVDIGELLPGMSDEVMDAVLDHWSGPGVQLVVDRDGEQITVGL